MTNLALIPTPRRRLAVILIAATGLIIFGLAARGFSNDVPDLEEVLTRTREAVFGEAGQPGPDIIELKGPARIFDMDVQGVMVFDAEGRFRNEFSGQFTQIFGHDGEHTWEQRPNGNVNRLREGNANFQQLFNWFLMSHWLSPESGLQLSINSQATKRGVVGVLIDAGHGAEATVLIDRTTWLPSMLKAKQFGRDMIVHLEWGGKLGARAVPTHMEIVDGGQANVAWDITDSQTLATTPSYAQPKDAIRVVHDTSIDPNLRVMKASGGHLWVRPLINGQDVGWFAFDTGATGTVIDESIARKLGLPIVGEVDSTGIGGRSMAMLRTVESMELAGVRVEDIPIVSRDLSGSDRTMGVDVAGLLGVDLLAHGIIIYDEREVAIEFHVPEAYELPAENQWVDMPLHNGKPAVHLVYEGHEGLFVIDTGAPGRLIIGPHAIERHDLFKGRTTQRSKAYGSGGSVAARTGTIDDVLWGGQRFENIPTLFITEDQGAGADMLRDGIVGANLIRRFIVVFDIEGERTAFLERR